MSTWNTEERIDRIESIRRAISMDERDLCDIPSRLGRQTERDREERSSLDLNRCSNVQRPVQRDEDMSTSHGREDQHCSGKAMHWSICLRRSVRDRSDSDEVDRHSFDSTEACHPLVTNESMRMTDIQSNARINGKLWTWSSLHRLFVVKMKRFPIH